MRPGYFGEYVWSPSGERTEGMVESKGPEYEEKFVKILCDDLCKILGVTWHDQRVVTEVLKFALNDKIRDLLNQYLNSQLEIVARSMKAELDLPEAKVDHGYAVHARFNTIVEEIKSKIKKMTTPPEMSNETIEKAMKNVSER